MVRNGNIWKAGSLRKEIRIMLGNDRRSKMPTAPISFYEGLFPSFYDGLLPFFFFKKYLSMRDFFPFSIGQKSLLQAVRKNENQKWKLFKACCIFKETTLPTISGFQMFKTFTKLAPSPLTEITCRISNVIDLI